MTIRKLALAGSWLAFLCVAVTTRVAAAEGTEGEGEMPYLLSSTIWAIVSFAIVLFILVKFLFPRIIAAMDARTMEIRESLEAAEKARAEAATMMVQHKEDMVKARAEAASVLEQAKSDAEKLKGSIVDCARHEAEEIAERSKREIEQAKTSAIDELHRQATDLSIDIASRLVRKTLSPEDHKQLIDERLKDFKALN